MMMTRFKRFIIFMFKLLLKSDLEVIESHYLNKRSTPLEIPLWKFRMIYKISDFLCTESVWLVFLIDNRAKVFCSLSLDTVFEVTSFSWINSSKFSFLPNTTEFLPKGENQRKGYVQYLRSEIKDHKLLLLNFVIMGGFTFLFNRNIELIEKLINANLTIITIFISIFLVLFALNTNRSASDQLNEFYSGVYHIKYEFNINTFYTAILSISLSLLTLVTININLPTSLPIYDLLKTIGRVNISTLLSIMSLYLSFICLLNIAKYYLKYDREKYYSESISKIIIDQKENIRSKLDK